MKCASTALLLIGSASAFTPCYHHHHHGRQQRSIPNTVAILSERQRPSSVSLNMMDSSLLTSAAEIGQDAILAGAALVGLAGIALSANGKSADKAPTKKATKSSAAEEPVEKVDLSIPYDAAARLAFEALPGGKKEEATFKKFKELYETKAVAQATAKKLARDALLEGEKFAVIAAQAEKDMAALV